MEPSRFRIHDAEDPADSRARAHSELGARSSSFGVRPSEFVLRNGSFHSLRGQLPLGSDDIQTGGTFRGGSVGDIEETTPILRAAIAVALADMQRDRCRRPVQLVSHITDAHRSLLPPAVPTPTRKAMASRYASGFS